MTKSIEDIMKGVRNYACSTTCLLNPRTCGFVGNYTFQMGHTHIKCGDCIYLNNCSLGKPKDWVKTKSGCTKAHTINGVSCKKEGGPKFQTFLSEKKVI